MTSQRTLRAAFKRIRKARDVTYDGIMFEDGRTPRSGEWVNGIRASDWDLVIVPLLDKANG